MVTDSELERLISRFPTLYHMAARGSWEGIKAHGLLSTSALLDKYEIEGECRRKIECAHRSTNVKLKHQTLPTAVVRDQLAMSDSRLEKLLEDQLKPCDWYKILNSKVFFWLCKERLYKLTEAKEYKDSEHDILIVDTKKLIDAERSKVCLSPINSGSTWPSNAKRGKNTFKRIEDYDLASRKKVEWKKRVAELTVEHSVPNIQNYIERVVVMKGRQIIKCIE